MDLGRFCRVRSPLRISKLATQGQAPWQSMQNRGLDELSSSKLRPYAELVVMPSLARRGYHAGPIVKFFIEYFLRVQAALMTQPTAHRHTSHDIDLQRQRPARRVQVGILESIMAILHNFFTMGSQAPKHNNCYGSPLHTVGSKVSLWTVPAKRSRPEPLMDPSGGTAAGRALMPPSDTTQSLVPTSASTYDWAAGGWSEAKLRHE